MFIFSSSMIYFIYALNIATCVAVPKVQEAY